jgi:hypothetical protein
MKRIIRTIALGLLVVAAVAGKSGWRGARAQPVPGVNARVVATNIPGASAIAQVGTFVTGGTLTSGDQTCANPSPIPTKFLPYVQPGKILDPTRLLVGSASNFGASLPPSGGRQGSFLSIDPSGSGTLVVPRNFDTSGDQEATLGGAVQMFSANSPFWLNGGLNGNNPGAVTAQYTGVGNPLGLSNNNGFGRIWPANSPIRPGQDKVRRASSIRPDCPSRAPPVR